MRQTEATEGGGIEGDTNSPRPASQEFTLSSGLSQPPFSLKPSVHRALMKYL